MLSDGLLTGHKYHDLKFLKLPKLAESTLHCVTSKSLRGTSCQYSIDLEK